MRVRETRARKRESHGKSHRVREEKGERKEWKRGEIGEKNYKKKKKKKKKKKRKRAIEEEKEKERVK